MASDIRAVEFMLRRDKEARLSASELIVELAKKIREKPEDLIWFFEIWRAKKESDWMAENLSDEQLWKLAVEETKKTPEVKKSIMELQEEARILNKKFKRIEKKLKKLGVI